MDLPISKLRLDGGTQPRAAIDFTAVDDYQDAMEAGAKFPPVTVFYDGTEYWVADGFHRIKAAFAADRDEIACDVRQGTLEDAQWFSFAANKANGLRRTNDDKQRAVKAALAHPQAAGKSDSTIAKHVGVDQKTVANWRGQLVASKEIPKIDQRTVTRNGTTYQQNTANIGKRKAEPVATTRPTPAPTQQPITTTPKPEPTKQEPSEDKIAAEWLEAIIGAVQVINDCEVTARDLVRQIRKENLFETKRAINNASEFLQLCISESANA